MQLKLNPPTPGVWPWLGKVLVLAAAYFVTGKLGLLLAVPPRYATCIWPPSGIALVGLLLMGPRHWPGVVLGSFCVNVGLGFDASSTAAIVKSLAIGLSIALGAGLQGVAGVWLLRRFIGWPAPLIEEGQIFRFLILSGPVSCLVNASWSVGTLWLSGAVPAANLLINSSIWWAGDTLGVWIFTMLGLLVFGLPRATWHPRRLSVGLPLVVTFAIAVGVFFYWRTQDRRELRGAFQESARQQAQLLADYLAEREVVVRGVASLFEASPNVDRRQFAIFTLPALQSHRAVQALEWVPRVPASARDQFEAAARRDGLAQFQFADQTEAGTTVRAPERPEYFPVHYVEPLAANQSALGYDLGSETTRRQALDRARDSGKPAATRRITLVQHPGEASAFLLFVPTYEGGPVDPDPSRGAAEAALAPPRLVEQRRERLLGYALGVFRMVPLVEEALTNTKREGVQLQVLDVAAEPELRLLYSSQPEKPLPASRTDGAEWSTELDVGGRTWKLQFTPTLAYLGARQSWTSFLVLLAGLLFTSLLGAGLLLVTGRTALVEGLVQQRSAELRHANEGLANEIAERKQIEARREALLHELEAKNSEMERFSYVVSHDLKSPLITIKSFLGMVENDAAAGRLDRLKSDLQRIAKAADKMGAMLEDLLKLSCVGRLQNPFALVPMHLLATEAVELLGGRILARGAQVELEPGLAAVSVWVDRPRLVEVLQNLVENAVKYMGDQAQPRIVIGTALGADGPRFYVRDNGMGIEPAHQSKVFGLFDKLDPKSEGTGIGLALVKRSIETHGGRIWVESEGAGCGATFWFTLAAPPPPARPELDH